MTFARLSVAASLAKLSVLANPMNPLSPYTPPSPWNRLQWTSSTVLVRIGLSWLIVILATRSINGCALFPRNRFLMYAYIDSMIGVFHKLSALIMDPSLNISLQVYARNTSSSMRQVPLTTLLAMAWLKLQSRMLNFSSRNALLLRRISLKLCYIGEMFRVATALVLPKLFLAGDSALLCLISVLTSLISLRLSLLIFALTIVMR